MFFSTSFATGKRGFGDAEDSNAEYWSQQCRIPADVGPPLSSLGEFGDADRVTSACWAGRNRQKSEPKSGSSYSALSNDSSFSPMKHDREQCTVQQKSMEKAGNPANPSAADLDDCSHPDSPSELATPMAPVLSKATGKKKTKIKTTTTIRK